MSTNNVTVRLHPELRAAAETMAGDIPLTTWIRGLVEVATGVKVPMPRGLAAVSKKRVAKIARAGGKAKAAGREAG